LRFISRRGIERDEKEMISHRKRNKVKSEINIAPFTDVILVLLIIFMITTPALMQTGIKVNIPKTEVSDSEDSTNIEVLISKEGYVYMDGKQVRDENVEGVMRELVGSNPGKSVVIRGDKTAKYDYVIQFMDKAKKAGATKFALAVENKITPERLR
jgi:biopolymer transport protein ExbD